MVSARGFGKNEAPSGISDIYGTYESTVEKLVSSEMTKIGMRAFALETITAVVKL